MRLASASGVTQPATVGCHPDVPGGRQPPHSTWPAGALPAPPPCLQPRCCSLPRAILTDGDTLHPKSQQKPHCDHPQPRHLQSPKPPSLGCSPPAVPAAPAGVAAAGSPGPRGGAGTWRCCRSCGPALASPPAQEGGGYPPAAPGVGIDRTRLPTPALPPRTPRLRAAPAPPPRPPAARQPRASGNFPVSPFTRLCQHAPSAGIHSRCWRRRPFTAAAPVTRAGPAGSPETHTRPRFLTASTPGFPCHGRRCLPR